MPELSGVDATRIIRHNYPDIKILMLTTFDDDEYVQCAIKFGASGYLLKDKNPSELILSIEAIMAGNSLLSESIMEKLVGYINLPQPNQNSKKKVEDLLSVLSRREREILSQLIQGYDNAQISSNLILGQQTVKNYISSIYSKLGVKNRSQAIKLVMEMEYNAREFDVQ